MYCIKLFCTSNIDSVEKKTHRFPVHDEDDALNARKQRVNISIKFTMSSWANLRATGTASRKNSLRTGHSKCDHYDRRLWPLWLSLTLCKEDINGFYFQVSWAVLLWSSCPGYNSLNSTQDKTPETNRAYSKENCFKNQVQIFHLSIFKTDLLKFVVTLCHMHKFLSSLLR